MARWGLRVNDIKNVEVHEGDYNRDEWYLLGSRGA